MTTAYLAFQGTAPLNTNKTWNDIQTTASGLSLLGEAGGATGWSLTAALVSGAIETGGSITTGTGDAAWVDEEDILQWGHYKNSTTEWASYTISGLSGADLYDFECICSAGFNRFTDVRVNGGTIQTQDSNVNDSQTLLFSDIAPASGVITVEFRQAAESSGSAYINAARLISKSPVPTLTLDQTELTPGGTISGSYSNFTGVPTSPLTLTDSNANSITVAVTVTDGGAGSGTFTGTLPTLPASGSQAGLLFGTVTVEIQADDITAPTLTAQTATSPAAGQVDWSVSTDEAEGTLYSLVSLNATETAATVKAATSQVVSATGAQTGSVTGLAAGTYYAHFVHADVAGNESPVATTASVVVA